MMYYVFREDGTFRYASNSEPTDFLDGEHLIESDIDFDPPDTLTLVDGEIVCTPYNPADYDYSDGYWEDLRNKRNRLLAETDFYGLPDVTMPEEIRVYRQQLRDLPANTEDPLSVVWPAKPTLEAAS